MSDLIERQEAIDAVCNCTNVFITNLPTMVYKADVYKALAGVLPAEAKKGKWIEQDDGWEGVFYECSVCNEAFTLMEGTPSDNLYNFCPNCGARMEESDDCN